MPPRNIQLNLLRTIFLQSILEIINLEALNPTYFPHRLCKKNMIDPGFGSNNIVKNHRSNGETHKTDRARSSTKMKPSFKRCTDSLTTHRMQHTSPSRHTSTGSLHKTCRCCECNMMQPNNVTSYPPPPHPTPHTPKTPNVQKCKKVTG